MSELTGLWIPLEYLRNARLSRNELVIISYLKYKSDKGVFKGNHVEISHALSLKKQRVSESILGLFQKGFLERTADQKYYILSEKYLDLESKKVTESVINTESVTVTESVTESYGKRDKKVTESVTPTYRKTFIKIDNNNSGEVLEDLEVLKQKETFKKSSKKVSLSEVEFMESEFADFEVFQQFIHEAHPDIDANYYYLKIKSWLDKNTAEKPKRKVWKNVINQFIQNDYKNGQVVTITKSKGHGKSTPNNFRQTNIFEQQATPEQLDDLVSQYFANR